MFTFVNLTMNHKLCYKLKSTIQYQKLKRTFFTTAAQQEKYTNFGYETIKEEEKGGKIREVFRITSPVYNKVNDVMTFGFHRLWKNKLISTLNPQPGTKLLDVASGTGDIAFKFLDYVKKQNPEIKSHVIVNDINPSMLNEGKKRAEKLGYTDDSEITWLLTDAENLPLQSESVDAYTISFGIRNVTHIDKILNEAYRVLKPGGRFVCLECSHVNNPIARKIYDLYLFNIIPVIGKIVNGDTMPYKYLAESIQKFHDQETLKKMIEDAGFSSVTYENLSYGIVAIHSGFKL